MATVYLRDGMYYAKFFDEDGKRTSRNTGVTKKSENLIVGLAGA